MLRPRHVFRISRGAKPFVENVFLALEQNGHIGYGEGSPNAYYGESAEQAHGLLLSLSDWLRRQTIEGPESIADLWHRSWEHLAPSRTAQCALDLALWDLAAKRSQVTVAELALGRPAMPVASSVTLGLEEKEEQIRQLESMRAFHRYKLKLDGEPDFDHIRFLIRKAPGLWAWDANGAWDTACLGKYEAQMQALSPTLLEQPFSPANDGILRSWKPHCPAPLYADESCRNLEDLPGLAAKYHGVNLKLVKAGGLTPALAMQKKAAELGLQCMVGCMLESSLLISAGLVLAQNAGWADLDGAWLLQHDPFPGLTWKEGYLHPSPKPGFGVLPEDRLPDFTR